MEECLHLAESQQSRLFGCRLREVHHHADVRTYVYALAVNPLSLKFCHPCSSLLALARMEVGIEHGEIRSVAVVHLIRLYVGMIHGDVLVLLECDAVQTVGKAEYSVYHARQLEVGAEHLSVEVILAHLQLVRIKSEVPRLHLKVVALLCLCLCLHSLYVLDGCRLVSVNEVVEQLIYVLFVGSHTMHEHVVGVCAITEQLRNLAAQIYQSAANLEIVLAVVVNALRVACHIHLAAQFALGGVSHER